MDHRVDSYVYLLHAHFRDVAHHLGISEVCWQHIAGYLIAPDDAVH